MLFAATKLAYQHHYNDNWQGNQCNHEEKSKAHHEDWHEYQTVARIRRPMTTTPPPNASRTHSL